MNQGSFELNSPGWYVPQSVVENDFLDNDQFGNTWYSVKFENDADTHLWLAKDKPEEGKPYYGHLEKTKSGKTTRFKRDSVPEDMPKPPVKDTSTYEPGTNARWAIGMAYKACISVTGSIPEDEPMWELVEEHALRLVKMFELVKGGGSPGSEQSEARNAPGATNETKNPSAAQPLSGFDKAKQVADSIKRRGVESEDMGALFGGPLES